jgi:hypothetical protein
LELSKSFAYNLAFHGCAFYRRSHACNECGTEE